MRGGGWSTTSSCLLTHPRTEWSLRQPLIRRRKSDERDHHPPPNWVYCRLTPITYIFLASFLDVIFSILSFLILVWSWTWERALIFLVLFFALFCIKKWWFFEDDLGKSRRSCIILLRVRCFFSFCFCDSKKKMTWSPFLENTYSFICLVISCHGLILKVTDSLDKFLSSDLLRESPSFNMFPFLGEEDREREHHYLFRDSSTTPTAFGLELSSSSRGYYSLCLLKLHLLLQHNCLMSVRSLPQLQVMMMKQLRSYARLPEEDQLKASSWTKFLVFSFSVKRSIFLYSCVVILLFSLLFGASSFFESWVMRGYTERTFLSSWRLLRVCWLFVLSAADLFVRDLLCKNWSYERERMSCHQRLFLFETFDYKIKKERCWLCNLC